MAKKSKLNLINDDLTWNADRRYKVNSVVQLNGEDYQNITGKNSNPELLIDWQKIYTDIAISDVTSLPTALDDLQLNKEDKANKNIANGYAGLDSSGRIIPTQLPDLAITDTFVVNSQAEMLALVAEVGDVAVRTDLNKSFILRVTGASTLANWQELLSPTSVDQTIIDGSTNAVSGNAVFNALAFKAPLASPAFTGTVSGITKTMVGLGNVDNTSDLNKPISTATANALALKADISQLHNPVTIGTANGLSLSTQQLSLGLASSGVTGALSGTDWDIFNGKFNTPTGLITNYLPKWNGTVFGNSGLSETSFLNYESSQFDLSHSFRIKNTNTNGNSASYARFENAVGIGMNIGVHSDLFSMPSLSFIARQSGTSLDFILGSATQLRMSAAGNTLFGKTNDSGDGIIQVNGNITASPAVSPNQVVVKSQLDAVAGRPYKVYVALLSQTGTNAPTAIVLENTLGGTVVWSRTGVGQYAATLSGVFTSSKTTCLISSASGASIIYAGRSTPSIVIVGTQTISPLADADGFLTGTIEIRVYN